MDCRVYELTKPRAGGAGHENVSSQYMRLRPGHLDLLHHKHTVPAVFLHRPQKMISDLSLQWDISQL
jgi:hypothetical protein